MASVRNRVLVKVVGAAAALSLGLAGQSLLAPTAHAASTPKVVLDPDHGYAHSTRGGVTYNSFDVNLEIAQAVQQLLPTVCDANITLAQTTDLGETAAARATRAAAMSDADVSVTLSMNSLPGGAPWGATPAEGGASSFATNRADNLAFGDDLGAQMTAATGRPHKSVNAGSTNGTVYPYPEYQGLQGTYAQFFMLFLDNNFDFDVWHGTPQYMVAAVTTSIAHALQAKGFACLGTFPQYPSPAELQRLRNLGYQQYLRYGAEPVSMSTGNFSTAEKTISLSGVGDQVIDTTLNYNAQSTTDSPVGFGWSFPYGSFLQQYSNGSVVVFLADGRALAYTPNGSGGFTSPAGAFATLTQSGSQFIWQTSTGTLMTFDQDSSGRGKLTGTTDRQGNGIALSYSGTGARFPKLSAITDQAGQAVKVETNSDGRITKLTRPDGAAWTLAYSATGDLTSLTSPRGTARQYAYDGQHRMTAETAQDGVVFLKNTYDAKSRVVDQENALGKHRLLAFEDSNKTTSYTDATGFVTVYRWNDLGEVTSVQDALGGTVSTSYTNELLPSNNTDELGRTTQSSYDTTGQPANSTDAAGSTVNRTYNTYGDLTSVTDQGGTGGADRTYTMTIGAGGRPTAVTNPDGSSVARAYDVHGDLTSSTDELGNITKYEYDARGNLIKVTDPLGRVSTKQYDAANRMTAQTDALGRTTSLTYDANDNVLTTTYADGSKLTRTYDLNDQLATVTDRRGGVTAYTRDAQLNLVKTTLPNGGTVTNTFDAEDRLLSSTDALGRTTTRKLDALGRVVSVTDPRGGITKMAYNAHGELTSVTDAAGSTTTFTRDALGRLVKATDPTNASTSVTWDKVGRRTSSTDELGHVTSYAYNFRDELTSSTDAIGGVTSSKYDAAGRLTSATDATGAATAYTYNAAGQLVRMKDALAGQTTYVYDLAGNRTSETDANGHITKTSYDAMNQPIRVEDARGKVTQLQRDAASQVTSSTDPLGHVTTLGYDITGNLTTSKDGLGRTTAFGYDLDNEQVSGTAADGVQTRSSYDPNGNLDSVVRNFRSGVAPSASVNVTSKYAYDQLNRMTSSTDPNGAVTKYAYDVRGSLLSVTDALGKVTSYAYDGAYNTVRRTDAKGVTTNYAYDPRNLLVKRAYPAGAADTFAYDADGRQTSASGAAGTVTTAYDLLGRTTSVTDANGKVLKYTYDSAGNRTGLTLPDSRQLTYGYDAADELTSLNSPLGALTADYDDAGRPTTVSRPNGTKTVMGYDAADEVTSMVTSSGAGTLASLAYGYDSVGNVSKRVQALGSSSTTATYSYDPLRRLLADAGGPLPSSYTYDAAGNRLSWSAPDDPLTPKPNDPFTQSSAFNALGQVTTSTINRQNGNATKTDVTSYTYDANGNQLKSDTTASSPGQSTSTVYSYDVENRLLSSMPGNSPQKGNGNGQRNFARTYDALGRVVNETRGTTTTAWVEDGLDPIVATDSTSTLYLRGTGGHVEGELASGGTPSWYVNDALGSILGSTDSKAKLGNVTTYTDYGVNIGNTYGRMGFGGELTDQTKPGNGIGNDTPVLSHYYARSYDPMNGSWLQQDPLSKGVRDINAPKPFAFVDSNPATNRDLDGYTLTIGSVGVAHPGTISSVGVANPNNGGPLQGGNVGLAVQPTMSVYELQPTWNPMITATYSPAAYGQVALTLTGPANLSGVQGSGAGSLLGGMPSGQPYWGSNNKLTNGDYYSMLSSLNDLAYYGNTTIVDGYTRANGTQVGMYERANWGSKSVQDVFERADKVLPVVSLFVSAYYMRNDVNDLLNGSLDEQVRAGTGLIATTATAADLGVDTVVTTGALSVGLGLAAAATSALAVGASIGDAVGTSSGYQQGISEKLDTCWPSCSNWQLAELIPSGLTKWGQSLFTDRFR